MKVINVKLIFCCKKFKIFFINIISNLKVFYKSNIFFNFAKIKPNLVD